MAYIQSGSRIETNYDDSLANQSIDLGKRRFVLTFPNSDTISGELDLKFILWPSLRTEATFVVDFNVHDDGNFYLAFSNQNFALTLDGLEPQAWILSTYVIANTEAESITCRLAFRPRTDQLVTSPHSNIAYAKFHMINHGGFLGERISMDQRSYIDRLTLRSADWRITIDSTEVTEKNIKALEGTGGYAVTHVGLVERLNGRTFTSDELQQVSGDLGLFLRFVNGWALSPTLIERYDQSDNVIWYSFGAPPTTEWKPHRQPPHNWFNRSDAKSVLPALYSEFDRIVRTPELREAVQRVVYWYVQGNLGKSGVDSSLILAHSALELLAWMYSVIDPGTRTMPKTKFKDKKYSWTDKIVDLLTACGIPTAVPAQLTVLQKFSATSGASSAPDSINKLRNDLVHPEKKNPSFSGTLVYEALSLSLWYIELVVLRRLNHSGSYFSRIEAKWAGESVKVPWAP